MVYNKTDWASHDVITTGKMNNIEDGIQTALNNSIFGHGGAEQPSEGTHVTNYIDLGDNFPKNALSGDVTYVRDGDDYKIYQYDGVSWVEQINPKFSQRLEETMLEAKAQTETLISENQVNVDKTINEVKEEQDNLQKGLNNLNTNAQDYANKALTDARANIATTAQDLTKKVQQETNDRVKAVSDATAHADNIVATAKSDLVNTISKETSDRNAAVTALDTKAKGYADTAKNDAISASTTALNIAKTDLTTSITKEVTDRTKAVSDLDTKAQGYATQAKTDAIATANGAVAKEVTDRQKAITDLDTKSTGAINQAKTDAQSALDALQVGGRNLLLNSKLLWPVSSNGGTIAQEAFDSATNMWHITSPAGSGINKGIYFGIAKNTSMPIPVGQPWTMSFDIKGTGLFKQVGPENSTTKDPTGNVPTDWTRVSATGIRGTANNIVLYFDVPTVDLDIYIKLPKLEIGNKATDYTQAPEDIVLDYTTKYNVISQSLTQYQATNDGKVTKAQSDATQALGLVATKVSQTDYNTKTGDLDSKYTAVKQTADQASTDIVSIKSTNASQDTKINTLTSDVSGTKQSISDIQTEQGKQSTKINTIQTDVSGTKQDISDIKDANGVQDGKIASISTTVDGLSSSFSTYQTTNDGKVAKAQADITANATAISQKVSQTAYDAKTGQLQTDLNTTTTTANQAKTDIVAIKKTDTDQDARMTTIESDANGVKTTVSSLQTTANTQAGSISTLQQRADGFDATVSTLGQINQLFNTEFTPDFAGWYAGISPSSGMYKTGNPLSSDISWSIGSGKYNGSTVLKHVYGSGNMAFFSDLIPVGEGVNITGSIVAMSTPEFTGSVSVAIYLRYYDSNKNYIGVQSADSGKWSTWTQKYIAQVTPTGAAYVSFNIQTNGNAGVTYYSQPMLTFSNKVGKYVQGNYNNNASVAKAQLTADNASLAISNYKSDADGRISKAQADIVVNANAITQKVSQTEYNAKTGDLTTKVNTAQSTADSAKSTISAYQTSNDGRVATAESNITQNTKAIATKVSQTTYDAKTNQLQTDLNTTTTTANKATTDIVSINQKDTSQDARMTTIESDASGVKTTVSNLQSDLGKTNGSISTLQQRADGFDATVTRVNNQLNDLSQVNMVVNSEFSPDLAGWYIRGTQTLLSDGPNSSDVGFNKSGHVVLDTTNGTGTGNVNYTSMAYPVTPSSIISVSVELKASVSGTNPQIGFIYYDANMNAVAGQRGGVPVTTDYKLWKYTGTAIPATAKYVSFDILISNVYKAKYVMSQPMMVIGSTVGAYVQGQYNNNGATARAQLTADQATTTINNYKTSNDGRVATAESNISQNATAITQKVSQTDYNQKTGQLQTDLNTTTNTANTAKQDIATIKTDNTKRDEKINTLESDSTETKRTISKLSGDLNTVSGDVSTLKQTAQGFEATVTKVNNLSVGGRNLLSNSRGKFQPNVPRIDNYNVYTNSTVYMTKGQQYTVHADASNGLVWTSTHNTNVESNNVVLWIVGGNVNTIISDANTGTGTTFTWNNPSGTYYIRVNTYKSDNSGYVENIKVEKGNIATDWSPAPEDVDSSISSVKQTADSASTAITNYKTSNDGRVSVAEGNIKTNADAITQKVSKIDYDQKTGELSGKISEVSQTSDKISQSVSDVKTKVDGLSVGGRNLVLGTSTDTAWTADTASKYSFKVIKTGLKPGQTYTFSAEVTLGNTDQKITTVSLFNEPIGQYLTSNDNFKADGTRDHWTFTVPTTVNTPTASLIIYAGTPGSTGGKSVTYHHIKVETGNLPTDWTPAPEDTDNKISTVSQTVDSISSIVSDPTTGLTKRVQTAEGTLSQVQGTDIPALQKATYWQPFTSLDLNTYTKQGSFFFNSTAVKPNAPTTKTNWMYLVVEQGTSDSGRVVQTAWYDTQTDAKITYRRQYAGAWSPWYANDNDSVTSISQTNGAIKQEVQDRTNGDSNTLTQAQNFTTSAITSSEGKTNTLITQTSDAIIAQVSTNNLVSNSEFDPLNKGWYPIGTTVGSVPGSESAPGSYTTSFSDWQIADGSQLLNYNSSTWYSTDLVQAQAQVVYSASIVAGRTALTNSVALDLRIAFFDSAKKLLGYASAGNIITGSAYSSLKLYKFENQMAPANTRYVSLVIAHSGTPTGGSDIIGRPTLNYGAKVTTYSPTKSSTASSVQLALMKDNWSVGINDNAGKLASGVFGTIDGMNLVGNKMTINANQTTITGTTWIQTGMIGQGIIGSAQISQLDVNKLVGNTSNFVKSAWDSAYGSTVTIDGSGMAIRAGGSNGFYTRLQSGKLQFESLYSDATLPGGVRHEVIGSVFGGSDAQVGGDVDALSFTLFDQTFPSFTDGYPVGSPKDGSGYIWGGDKITWNVADTQAGHVRELFGWYNATASNVQGISRGFNFFDRVNFNGSEIEISGAQNNLIFTWAQWNGYFSNEKSPAIVAANKGWRGGGIAFGNNNVVVYNAANGINKILM